MHHGLTSGSSALKLVVNTEPVSNRADVNLSAALALAAAGIPIFPAKVFWNEKTGKFDKRPCIAGWQADASTDPRQIKGWWTNFPNAVPGIELGRAGLIVIDLDRHPGAPNGVEAFQQFAGDRKIPPSPTTKTASNGFHLCFLQPEGEPLGNGRGALPPGIDIRGKGGWIVGPGATAEGGEWRGVSNKPPLTEAFQENTIPVLPDWIAATLRSPRTNGASPPAGGTGTIGPTTERERKYAEVALRNAADRVASAGRGSRNEELNATAFSMGRMIARGWLERGAVEGRLFDAMCANGYIAEKGKASAAATVKSGLDAGLKEPHADLPAGGFRDRAEQATPEAADQKLASNEDLVTEDAAALAFAERYRDTLRFDHDIGKWFVWTDIRWQCERTQLAFLWARELARELTRTQPNKLRLTSSKTTFASGVERFARTDRAFAVTSDIWDQNSYLLGTPAGVVDLRTGLLKTPVPEDFITKLTAIAPADASDCPRWQQFLREATNDDQALIDFLQQFVGYMLTGDTTEHSLLFIHGGGGNGKTVFQNTCSGILGDYAKVAAMETFVASGADKHPTDVAMLHGARLVTASETEEGRAWAESRIKQLTGGDKISARFMRQDFFEFTPQFKLMLIGNHQPTLRNVDDAARRRFNIVPFIHKPPVPDRSLEAKLRQEWPGILRWMIDGCLLWQHSGLVRPQVVLDATEEYFVGQDLIQQWIEDRCETGKITLTDTSANLFRSWTAWAIANGERPGASKWFGQALQRLGFKPYRKTKARGFFGIEAKAEQVQPHWAETNQ